MSDYLEINRASWDDRADAHFASPDYDVERLLSDDDELSHVVAFDLPRLGRLDGLDVCHLQCHIGTDTLSLSRLGARTVTGLDFSARSLERARDLARQAGADIRFVESDVYDAPVALSPGGSGPSAYDLVYTGIGALCWLPSIERWADVVTALLRPGGRVFLREGHPMLFALADATPGEPDQPLVVTYPYFETTEPMVFDDGGTYVQTDHVFTANTTKEWAHGVGGVITALLDRGMRLTGFTEHDTVPWPALDHLMEPAAGLPGEFRLIHGPERVAMSYTLQAVKAV